MQRPDRERGRRRTLEIDLAFYDLTSTYFEGHGPEPLAAHGYSRDGVAGLRGGCGQRRDSAAITPDLGDAYASAVTNFGFMANAVLTTEQAVAALGGSG